MSLPSTDPSDAGSVHIGDGTLSLLPTLLDELHAGSVFLVVDERAAVGSGFSSELERLLGSRRVTRFIKFEPNPKLEDVERGVVALRAAASDAVVAFGGGTAIDVAKLVAGIAPQSASARDITTGAAPLVHPGPPLVAIPTTAGTGSEATHFAVVYVDGRKRSVAHETLLPTRAIIDPLLTHRLRPRLTAASGLDAFCQAIESIWAVGATGESVVDATSALRLAFANLERAVRAPDPAARAAMCRAAHCAGRAINVGKTTLCHALSYPITSNWNVPHGEAVAATLAATLRFNAGVTADDCADPRGPQHVRDRIAIVIETLGTTSVDAACREIERLVAAVGAAPTARAAGVHGNERIRVVLDQVDPARMSNNPRRPTREDLHAILSGDSSD